MKASNKSPPTVKTDWIGGHFRSFRRNPPEFLTRIRGSAT
jgi:hypothetical protein